MHQHCRPRPQLPAQEQIADAAVGQGRDAMPAQQVHERRERVGGVADGVDGGLGVGHWACGREAVRRSLLCILWLHIRQRFSR